MKSQNIKIVILLAAIVAGMIGCDKKQDPTQENKYAAVRDAVPQQPRKDLHQKVLHSPYAINIPMSEMTFVQGEAKTVEIEVMISPYVKGSVNYRLEPEDKTLLNMGAKFVRKSKEDKWMLSWQPRTDVLNSSENYRRIHFNLIFALDNNNSAEVVSAFAGLDLKTEAIITLQKNQDQPIIHQEFNISPIAPLNPSQNAKIQFKVETSNSNPAENVELHLSRGPEEPSKELLIVDGVVGSRREPHLVKVFNEVKNGRRVVLYEMEFDSRHYTDYVLNKIDKSSIYRNKFAAGKAEQVESEFYVTAYDKYNKTHSADLKVNFKVNLSELPSKLVIVGQETIPVKRGSFSQGHFLISSTDSRSQVKIIGLNINGTDISMTNGSGSYTRDDGTSVTLNCLGGGTAGWNNHNKCKVGTCYLECRVEAFAPCESTDQNIPLEIKTESRLGEKVKPLSLLYTVKVNGKIKQCEAVVAPKVQADHTATAKSGDTKKQGELK